MPNIVEIIIDGKDKFSDVSADVRREVKGLERDAEGMGQKIQGAMNIAAAATIAAGVGIVAGVLKASQAYAQYAERIRDVSIKTGESAENASRLVNAADDVGVSYEALSKGLNVFSRNMVQVQEQEAGFSTSLTNNQKVLESLGITVTDFNGQIRPTKDLLEDLSEVFSHMPDGPTKTGLAMQLFGRGGTEMIEFLNQGKSALQASYAEADKWGQILSGKDVEAAHQFTLAQRDMNDAVESMTIKIGQKAIPVLTELSRAFTHGMESEKNFEQFMKAGAFAIAALWTDAMILVSNAIISGFESAINYVIRKVNSLSDKLRVPDFVPGVGGDRLFPEIQETSMKRQELVDPMEGFRSAFPDITKQVAEGGDAAKKAAPDMAAYAEKIKAQGVAAKNAKELLDALTKGEVTLAMARKNGLGADGGNFVEIAKKAGALEGFAAWRQGVLDADEAAYNSVKTLSRIAELYQQNADAGRDYVLVLEREQRDKINAAMADVFGKPTREQNSLNLQIDQLELAIERANSGSGGRGTRYGPNDPANRGFAADPNVSGTANRHWNGYAWESGPGGGGSPPPVAAMEAQKRMLEGQLRQSQLVTRILEDGVKVNDRSALTGGEQATKARELSRAMLETTSSMRDLSTKNRKDIIPSMDEMRRGMVETRDASRVLSDDAFRHNLIPKSYDVAGAFDAINAAASALEGGARAAAAELNSVKAPGPAPAPGPTPHIKPPNVGDGGLSPSPFGAAMHGMGF